MVHDTGNDTITHEAVMARALKRSDAPALRRILTTSEYVHARVEPDELAHALATLPAVGAFSMPPGPLGRVTGGTLQAFLLVNWLVPTGAWIGAFGVTWSEGRHFERFLDALLPPLEQACRLRGARHLYYSGADYDSDWLCEPLEARGFELASVLRSYDKFDFAIPATGNAAVRVRRFTPADVAGVVAVELEAFEPLWQHDAASFLEVARRYPYFVVAEDDAGIVGYQFNTADAETGYLVRIAVHPRAVGTGVGARLMAEAVRYFASRRVRKIILNTEEQNTQAHALYERFGFVRTAQQGFVLQRPTGA